MKILLTGSSLSWSTIPWANVQGKVLKWQQKIYTASKENDIISVRKWQHILFNSSAAKLIATRRVTQDNKEKKNGGC
jgi:RNA-directed DNA polymerase